MADETNTNDSESSKSDELLKSLIAQAMTSGLNVSPDGNITFGNPPAGTGGEPGSMGAAGYAGPMRASDVPDWNATANIPVLYGSPQGIGLSPGTLLGRQEVMRQQPLGNGNMGQLMDMLTMVKGMPDLLQGQLLAKQFPGYFKAPMTPLENQMAMANYNHQLNAPYRQSQQQDLALRTASLLDERSAKRRVPLDDATKRMQEAYGAGMTDPTKLGELATGLGYMYGGGTSNSVQPPTWLGGSATGGFQPRLLVPPSVLQAIQPPAAPAAAGAPAAAPAQQPVMDSKPPAAQHAGKFLRDQATGKRYQSDGKTWIEVK